MYIVAYIACYIVYAMVYYIAMGGGGGGGGCAVVYFLVFGFWFSVFRFLVFARGLAHCLVCSAVV